MGDLEALEDVMEEKEGEEIAQSLLVLQSITAGNWKTAKEYQRWNRVAGQVANELSYEDSVTFGMALRESHDLEAFVLGDLALISMGVDHGEKGKKLSNFASAIGMSFHALRERADTAAFYPPVVRMEIMPDPSLTSLTWSHFNRARRGRELDEARLLLAKAEADTLSVTQMEILGKQGDKTESALEEIVEVPQGAGKSGELKDYNDILNDIVQMTNDLAYRLDDAGAWQRDFPDDKGAIGRLHASLTDTEARARHILLNHPDLSVTEPKTESGS